jgi:hypothetical protein
MSESRQFFVSYSRRDVAIAGSVMAELEHAGTHVWTDSGIKAGEDWVDAIERGMTSSDVILVIVSSAFLHSQFCMYELGFALQQQRAGAATIVPVAVSDTAEPLPASLSGKFPVIDGRGLRAEQIVGKVLDRLRNPPAPPALERAEA